MENNNGKMLIALITGAAIGAGLGILFAPAKGSKTRKNIKHKVSETTQDVSDWLAEAKEEPV